MSTTLLLKRGNTSQTSTFTGLSGEITIDTDKNTIVVHDGSTAGGHEISGSDDYARPHSNAAFTLANTNATLLATSRDYGLITSSATASEDYGSIT